MDNVMTFLALLALFIFTAGILGMNLFGGKYDFPDENEQPETARANFDDLFWALVTVFQVRLTDIPLETLLKDLPFYCAYFGKYGVSHRFSSIRYRCH